MAFEKGMDPVGDENRQDNQSDSGAESNQAGIDAPSGENGADMKGDESANRVADAAASSVEQEQTHPNAGGSESAASPAGSTSGLVSQDDIDALFDSGGSTPQGDAAHASDNVSEGASSEGAVGQADIDALMNAAQDTSPSNGDTNEASPEQEAGSRVDTLDGQSDEAAAIEEEEKTAGQAKSTQPQNTPEFPPTPAGPLPETVPLALSELNINADLPIDAKKVTMLNDVNLRVKLQLGETKMIVEDILNLAEGSVVELDKLAGDPVDVLVNDRLVARGEVLVLNDNFCVRISEVLSHDPHRITT